MYRILKKFVIAIFLFFSFNISVSAIDCEYLDKKLIISYDKDSKAIINYEGFNKYLLGDNALNFVIAKKSKTIYSTKEIDIDQSLFKKYQGYSCPSQMYVCETGKYSINVPSIKSGAFFTANLYSIVPCALGIISGEICDTIDKEAYALLTLGEKKLHVMTQEQYEKSNFEKSGGVNIDGFKNGWELCGGDNDGAGWKIWAGICGTAGTVLSPIKDTVLGDGVEIVHYNYVDCKLVNYEGPYNSFNINCGKLQNSFFEFSEAIKGYSSCSDEDCRATKVNDVNKSEEKMKTICSSYLKNYNYNGGQSGCIDSCLNLGSLIKQYKIDAGIETDINSGKGECNFSDRLLIWVRNILKWIKYILPVLVIILSILDFIKAIASSNDDEFKKAQQRFIKRLIAAALLFLVPFIIEFALKTFNIGDANPFCGILD